MEKFRVYITGSAAGHNPKQSFIEAMKLVESFGFSCSYPNVDLSIYDKKVIKGRICELFRCTDILLLEGWNYCSLASLEHKIAQQLGMGIHTSIEELTNKYKNNGWA